MSSDNRTPRKNKDRQTVSPHDILPASDEVPSDVIPLPLIHKQRYLYHVVTHNTNMDGNGERVINQFAEAGWRLVAVSGDIVKFMYFEREIDA